LFLLYTDGLYGAGEANDRRLAPAEVAKQLLDAPGEAQSLLHDLLREPIPSPVAPLPPDDIAALSVRRLNGKN
jgi:hypothetical protein